MATFTYTGSNRTASAGTTGTGLSVSQTSPSLVTPSLGVAGATSINFAGQTAGIIGTTTNNNANTGSVGEYIAATLTVGTPVSLTTDTAADLLSINLTAGDWDVWGNVGIAGTASTTVMYVQGWTSQTSATQPTRDFLASISYGAAGIDIFGGANVIFNVQQQRINLASTTTIYLSVQVGFDVDTCSAYGNIRARRRR